MLYLFAAIGLITMLVLLWKAFGPDTKHKRVIGPDDDPDFLGKLQRNTRPKNEPGTDPGS